MCITSYAGAPGVGKTQAMLADVVEIGGHWLLACPRIELIRERMRDLRRIAAAMGREPTLIEVHGEQGRGAVVPRIRTEMRSADMLADVVICITHDSLMMLDPMDFVGWGVAIDEQVAGCKSGLTVVAARARMLADIDLLPREGSIWRRLAPSATSVTVHDLLSENPRDPLIDVVKWAGSPHGVLTTASSWDDLRGSNRPLRWVSVWTYGQLRHASQVLVAAAGLANSLTHLATRKVEPDVSFSQNVVGVPRTARPSVTIRYFADAHRGSTSWWSKTNPEGRAVITRIAAYMAQQEVGYWAANDAIADLLVGRINGQMIAVKIEGSNELRHHMSCLLLFSGKATPADEPLIDYLDIDADTVIRARECEDIAQFAMRGALRQADFTGLYTVHLYDRWQAEWLAGYLAESGIADGTVEHVALDGVEGLARPKAGRRVDTTRSAAEKAEARRARDRARKERQRREAGVTPRGKKSEGASGGSVSGMSQHANIAFRTVDPI